MRPTLLIAISPLFLAGCAATRTAEIMHEGVPEALSASSLESPLGTTSDLRFAPSATTSGEARAAEPVSATPPTAPQAESLHSSRFTLKGGYYSASEDSLDDGYILGISWMRFMSRFFALEFEVGYVDADGSDGGTDFEVWSLPIMLNGRFNLPVWVLDLYAGAGAGTFYYDTDASGAISDSDDGFVWGANAFLGATINVADRIALGLEAKYYLTDDVDPADEGLDAAAIMLTLGFSN